MYVFKNKYYLIIQSIKDINLSNIKKYNKIIIIYRNLNLKENIYEIYKFRKKCKLKKIKFFIANNISLAVKLKADGIYLSAYNNSFKCLNLKRINFNIIGSAHNLKEIKIKIKQGCSDILISKLFNVDYKKEGKIFGEVQFNMLTQKRLSSLIPLGGINITNLNKLRSVNCKAFAILSAIKKKPANIINRLF